jgi:predicted DNA-binding transcriptional regulator AlpA
MQVLSYDQCAARAGCVRRTFEREIAEGRGPAVVEISARRRGVLESDFETWLLGRRRPMLTDPTPPPAKRGRGRPRKVPSGEAA